MNSSFQAPPLTKINKILLISSVTGFILNSLLTSLAGISLLSILGLSAKGVAQGFIFQIVTYPFVDQQLMSVLFSGLILWFIGSSLEQSWGQKVYLRFLLMIQFVVGVIYLAISFIFFFGTPLSFMPIYGLAIFNYGLLVAYATLNPDREMLMFMIFPMKAKYFCLLLVGIELYFALMSSWKTAWVHLMAMGLGYVLIKFQNHLWMKKLFNFQWFNHGASRKSSTKHLKLIKEKKDDHPPKYWQ